MNGLDMEIQFLPGVGPKRAALLQKELGVSTVGDLLGSIHSGISTGVQS